MSSNSETVARPEGLHIPRVLAPIALRLSSLALIVLAAGAVISVAMTDEGLARFGFAYLSSRWSSIWWQTWDFALLWLALVHGGHATREYVHERVKRPALRFWLTVALAGLVGTAGLLGTVTILTFDPTLAN
ncbi:MAG: succinate dehydrogenase [Corynebacteriales bacterium]|nr:succinate dehydrogenase [Mycobacteriales bacterium]